MFCPFERREFVKKLFFFIILVGACLFFLNRHFSPLHGSNEPRDPQVLLDLLAKAEKENARVVIPPGVYRFCDTRAAGVNIQGMRRATIVADGVTVVFKPGQSLSLNDCEDVTLSGLTVDYDPLPFTQGMIMEIDQAEKSLTVALDDGYPDLESLPKTDLLLHIIFDPATLDPRPMHTDYFRKRTPLGNRAFKLSNLFSGFAFDPPGPAGGARAGDRIALLSRQGTAVNIRRGTRVRLEGVTVFTSPGYAFWEVDGDGGNQYKKCRILRKPGTTRLVTTVADGLHSYHVRKGPLIEECQFEDTVDDTIAIHGFFSIVLEAPSAHTVFIVSPFGQDFSTGARLEFHEMPHGLPLGEAVVKSVEKIPPSALAVPVADVRQSFIRQNFNLRNLPVTQALKVELDRDIALPPGKLVLISSSEQCGSGAIIRNNTLRGGHVRGVIVKADNVLVEGNRFEGIGANAILVFPELHFLEGPISSRVTIRGNTITHCGWKVLSPGHAVPGVGGAIQTCTGMARAFPPQCDPYPVIRDVTISNNTIKDSGSYGITLGNVLSGTISGNTIDHPFNKPGTKESRGLAQAFDSQAHGLEKPADTRAHPAGILVYGSQDVVLSGNTVTPSAENGGVSPLVVGPWCRNVQNAGK